MTPFPMDAYLSLKNALSTADVDAARQAYIELGTAENARKAFELAVDGDSHAIVDFCLNHQMRDSADTPNELRNINFQKMLDSTKGLDAEGVRIYTPKKKTALAIDLTGKSTQGTIEKGEI